MATQRGCGSRSKGGIYASCPLGEDGQPLEYFLIDHPKVIDIAALGIPKRGVKMFALECDGCKGSGSLVMSERSSTAVKWARVIYGETESGSVRCPLCEGSGTVNHLYDWIGEQHYPIPTDYLEEVRVLGMSRKLSPTLDYHKLTRGSKIFQIHSRGYVDNFASILEAERAYLSGGPQARVKSCPRKTDLHTEEAVDYCARFHWQTLPDGELINIAKNERVVARSLPCGARYGGLLMPGMAKKSAFKNAAKKPSFEPLFLPALICWFPIAHLAVISDKGSTREAKAIDAASKAAIPVKVEEE